MKTTHLQRQKEKYEFNHLYIQRELGIPDVELELLMVEIGCQYLERLYTDDETYEMIAFTPDYWKWFKVEFNNVLNRLIHLNEVKIIDRLKLMIYDHRLNESFKNFIKIQVRNGKY